MVHESVFGPAAQAYAATSDTTPVGGNGQAPPAPTGNGEATDTPPTPAAPVDEPESEAPEDEAPDYPHRPPAKKAAAKKHPASHAHHKK